MRISIDPNVRSGRDETFTGFGDVFGEIDDLGLGDPVIAMGLESDVVWDARVSRIAHDVRLVYLSVDWRSGREDIA